MRGLKVALLLGVLAVIGAGGVWWLMPRAASVLVEEARAAAVMPSAEAPLAVTLAIRNRGGPDRLLSLSSPEAARVVLAAAEDPAGLAIPAGATPSLALDGAHGMLMGLEGARTDGRLIPLVLTFAKAGPVSVKARLAAPATGSGDATGHMAGHGMHGAEMLELAPAEAPQVALAATRDGEGWRILADVSRFRFAPEAMDGAHAPGEGHGHLYVGGLKIGRMTGPELRLGRLPPGRHRVRLTLNTNDHRAYATGGTAVTAEIAIEQP
ncbi:MAG: copper chaperone PCu(A)C [Pseudomonadota bacterium]